MRSYDLSLVTLGKNFFDGLTNNDSTSKPPTDEQLEAFGSWIKDICHNSIISIETVKKRINLMLLNEYPSGKILIGDYLSEQEMIALSLINDRIAEHCYGNLIASLYSALSKPPSPGYEDFLPAELKDKDPIKKGLLELLNEVGENTFEEMIKNIIEHGEKTADETITISQTPYLNLPGITDTNKEHFRHLNRTFLASKRVEHLKKSLESLNEEEFKIGNKSLFDKAAPANVYQVLQSILLYGEEEPYETEEKLKAAIIRLVTEPGQIALSTALQKKQDSLLKPPSIVRPYLQDLRKTYIENQLSKIKDKLVGLPEIKGSFASRFPDLTTLISYEKGKNEELTDIEIELLQFVNEAGSIDNAIAFIALLIEADQLDQEAISKASDKCPNLLLKISEIHQKHIAIKAFCSQFENEPTIKHLDNTLKETILHYVLTPNEAKATEKDKLKELFLTGNAHDPAKIKNILSALVNAIKKEGADIDASSPFLKDLNPSTEFLAALNQARQTYQVRTFKEKITALNKKKSFVSTAKVLHPDANGYTSEDVKASNGEINNYTKEVTVLQTELKHYSHVSLKLNVDKISQDLNQHLALLEEGKQKVEKKNKEVARDKALLKEGSTKNFADFENPNKDIVFKNPEEQKELEDKINITLNKINKRLKDVNKHQKPIASDLKKKLIKTRATLIKIKNNMYGKISVNDPAIPVNMLNATHPTKVDIELTKYNVNKDWDYRINRLPEIYKLNYHLTVRAQGDIKAADGTDSQYMETLKKLVSDTDASKDEIKKIINAIKKRTLEIATLVKQRKRKKLSKEQFKNLVFQYRFLRLMRKHFEELRNAMLNTIKNANSTYTLKTSAETTVTFESFEKFAEYAKTMVDIEFKYSDPVSSSPPNPNPSSTPLNPTPLGGSQAQNPHLHATPKITLGKDYDIWQGNPPPPKKGEKLDPKVTVTFSHKRNKGGVKLVEDGILAMDPEATDHGLLAKILENMEIKSNSSDALLSREDCMKLLAEQKAPLFFEDKNSMLNFVNELASTHTFLSSKMKPWIGDDDDKEHQAKTLSDALKKARYDKNGMPSNKKLIEIAKNYLDEKFTQVLNKSCPVPIVLFSKSSQMAEIWQLMLETTPELKNYFKFDAETKKFLDEERCAKLRNMAKKHIMPQKESTWNKFFGSPNKHKIISYSEYSQSFMPEHVKAKLAAKHTPSETETAVPSEVKLGKNGPI